MAATAPIGLTMSKVEPIELIENPLATEDEILMCPLTEEVYPKNNRLSGENSNFTVLVTSTEEPSRFGLSQSQSHHLIGTGPNKSSSSVKIVDGTRNRHSSGCLPTDPLLSSLNTTTTTTPSQLTLKLKTLQTRLEDDGYCSSFTSKNSEG
ncbi:unnamed protein product [Allacma fusca]|uniref:Uncharacterized protein n=1 Tax=Allacma fusca TaxID=39272 RepID=A0A8J2L5A4_9HEXA|nr:unnamed protein product [Allacma fusca]